LEKFDQVQSETFNYNEVIWIEFNLKATFRMNSNA